MKTAIDGVYEGSEIEGDVIFLPFSSAPNLLKAKGKLDIHAGASLPELLEMEGDIIVRNGVSVPKLRTVSGDCMFGGPSLVPIDMNQFSNVRPVPYRWDAVAHGWR